MRIAFLSNVVYPFVTGGAEKRIHEIGTRLVDRGHDVTVYGRHFWDGPKETTYEGLNLRAVAPEAELYVGERRSIIEAIDYAVRLAAPLRRRLRSADHDLVVASVFPYFPVLAAELSRVGTGTPLVTTWHEVWGDYWDEYLGYFAPFGRYTESLTARVPQFPVAISRVTADRLASVGSGRNNVRVIPNGIDTARIRSVALPDESYDVLYAGRLVEHKNVDVLLEAFDRIAADHDVRLGIVGDGPEMDRLRTQRENLAHTNRVDFLGFLDDYDDVLGQMRAAEVFASPSTREGFGITFAEAMAADCVVVAADHPDSAADEVVAEAGFVCKPTVESVSRHLRRAVSGERPPTDPVERASRFDWEQVADQAETAYRQAIDGEW